MDAFKNLRTEYDIYGWPDDKDEIKRYCQKLLEQLKSLKDVPYKEEICYLAKLELALIENKELQGENIFLPKESRLTCLVEGHYYKAIKQVSEKPNDYRKASLFVIWLIRLIIRTKYSTSNTDIKIDDIMKLLQDKYTPITLICNVTYRYVDTDDSNIKTLIDNVLFFSLYEDSIAFLPYDLILLKNKKYNLLFDKYKSLFDGLDKEDRTSVPFGLLRTINYTLSSLTKNDTSPFNPEGYNNTALSLTRANRSFIKKLKTIIEMARQLGYAPSSFTTEKLDLEKSLEILQLVIQSGLEERTIGPILDPSIRPSDIEEGIKDKDNASLVCIGGQYYIRYYKHISPNPDSIEKNAQF